MESKQKKVRIQVLMSTYNGETYLKEQIDSLINQKDVSLSILVRDDGSSDGTICILDEYKNKGVLDWYTGERLFAPRSYLDLISHSSEVDYYAFCDQDDVWDSDKLITAISRLNKKDSEIPALYYSGLRAVDENLNFLFNHKIDTRRSIKTCFLMSNIAGCTAVFNKSLRSIVKEKKPQYFQMHDNWVYMVCASVGGIIEVDPEPHISYRQHGHNTVGIGNNLKSKWKEVKHYIYDRQIKRQCESLLNCFGSDMTPDFLHYVKKICSYDSSFIRRISFSLSREYNFHSFSLDILMRIKILIGKL